VTHGEAVVKGEHVTTVGKRGLVEFESGESLLVNHKVKWEKLTEE